MLYLKPNMEVLYVETENVVRTSGYHDPNEPGGDVTETPDEW